MEKLRLIEHFLLKEGEEKMPTRVDLASSTMVEMFEDTILEKKKSHTNQARQSDILINLFGKLSKQVKRQPLIN